MKNDRNHPITIEQGSKIEEQVVAQLLEKKYTITTAESCTGGLISARLVNVPGVSEVFRQGFVTYSNKAKKKTLGVKKQTLDKYGAVSKQTAKQMAIGAAMASNSDVTVAVTGIAGPDGGTEEKPVGLVYIACYVAGETVCEKYVFTGDRMEIRELTVVNALHMVNTLIK